MAINVRRLGYALGAEITGIDASRPLDAEAIAAIRRAWLDHIVVVLPAQNLEPDGFRAFCASLGPLDTYNIRDLNRIPDRPELIMRANKPLVLGGKTTKKSSPGDVWHSDFSYSDRPSSITFLHGKDLPDVGGDTMFSNTYLAYETLSPAMRAMIDPIEAVHDITIATVSYLIATPERQAQIRRENPPVVHPLVRVHPETGRKALYVADRVRNFVGMTEEETKPLLDFLRAHAVRYEFIYRHRWSKGDLLMWDNRCALHYAVQDYDQGQLRRTLRASLETPSTGKLLEPEPFGV